MDVNQQTQNDLLMESLEPTVTSLIKIYEQLAIRKYERQCAILKLGLEDLAEIFKFLETEDRMNTRLVCKSFKESLDQFVGIYVNLDQNKIDTRERWYSVGMPPPGASSLRLWSIVSPKYLDYVLKRSDLITEVQFAGQVTLSCVTKILTRCLNLRKLAFTDRSHMYTSLMPVRLYHLHTLDIGCPGLGTDYVGEDAIASTLWMTYEMILKKLSVPNLKIFRIYFCCVEDCTILHRSIAQIFRFISSLEFLEEISVSLHHRYERFTFLENDTNYQRFRIDIPKKILRSLQLKRVLVETMEPAFKIWDSVLPSQRSLTHLNIMNRNRKWFYYSKLVYNNYSTLKEVRLHNISPSEKTPCLDASIFSVCRSLETLFLSRFENSTQEIVYCYPKEKGEFPFLDVETSSTPELGNLKSLPENMKNLHIQGLVTSTKDLLGMVRKLKKLNLLELQLLGYNNPNQGRKKGFIGSNLGVNAEVLREIFHRCRYLNTIFIEEFVNPWTQVRDPGLWDAITDMSHVPGEGYSNDGDYYGLLICSEPPKNNGRLTRAEKMHLWDVRLSQYFTHSNIKRHTMRRRKSGSFELENDEDGDCKEDPVDEVLSVGEFKVDPIISETSLLEIIDKENGQLEKIHRMLNAGQTPRPATPSQIRAEETRRFAEKYSSTLYSAIPNYHKASRLHEDIPKQQ